MILDMPVGDRLRLIESNANFFSSIRPLGGRARDAENDDDSE
jgi:hypothetical protein